MQSNSQVSKGRKFLPFFGGKLNGKTNAAAAVTIDTYEDHRMAMCFAPLSLLHPQFVIEEPWVVKKSYPSFWDDFSKLGFVSSIG